MSGLAQQISDELRVLLGEPLSEGWRAADMQIFGFGPARKCMNRLGQEVEIAVLRLHVQCRWRIVDGTRILFGRDDLLRPADKGVPLNEFDWDKDKSVLDVARRDWFDSHRSTPPRVVHVEGDAYGGCRIQLEKGMALELFPCDSSRGEYSEHWRFFGHRPDGSHFVVTGDGITSEQDSANGE